MPLASIQPILAVSTHPNADSLDLVKILGYSCIVKRNTWKVGDLAIFIEPDSVLPNQEWAAFYKAKSSRVKAIRLRNIFSFGIVESFANICYTGEQTPGLDISESIGVTKYEPPAPQDLDAAGPYSLGIPKTDETRYQLFTTAIHSELTEATPIMN